MKSGDPTVRLFQKSWGFEEGDGAVIADPLKTLTLWSLERKHKVVRGWALPL